MTAEWERSRSAAIDQGRPRRFIVRFKESQYCPAVPPLRDQNLEHFPFVVDSAPKAVSLAVDANEHLVKVPASV